MPRRRGHRVAPGLRAVNASPRPLRPAFQPAGWYAPQSRARPSVTRYRRCVQLVPAAPPGWLCCGMITIVAAEPRASATAAEARFEVLNRDLFHVPKYSKFWSHSSCWIVIRSTSERAANSRGRFSVADESSHRSNSAISSASNSDLIGSAGLLHRALVCAAGIDLVHSLDRRRLTPGRFPSGTQESRGTCDSRTS